VLRTDTASIRSSAVPKATKRERQRINRELRREAMRKAEQRRKTMRTVRNVGIAVVIVAVVFGVIKLLQGDTSSSNTKTNASKVTCQRVEPGSGTNMTFAEPPPMTIDTTKIYTADIDTSCGKISVALDAVDYPVAVNNFVFLAQQKFYDGLDFARAAKNFTIQAGSPNNTQDGGPGYTVVGAVPTTSPAYPVGSFAMAKSSTDPAGTAGSQFFVITGSANLSLPADYAFVGTVKSGLPVAKKITSFAPSSGDGVPTTTVKINSITIQVADAPATSTTAAPTTTAAP
jgi:peptidyl-prolyl cis-trans isomerase B (cyclophilin B)